MANTLPFFLFQTNLLHKRKIIRYKLQSKIYNMVTKSRVLIILVVLAASSDAQQCNRRIEIGKTSPANLTIPLTSSGLTCLSVSPPDDEDNFVLLKLPASLSVTLAEKTYESKDASHRHCFVMTPNKRCPIWHEKIRETCPGGATAQPIFGQTEVYIKTVAGSTQGGSNETTIEYKLIHRQFTGFIHGECTDLKPPAVEPTTDSTFHDATMVVTSTTSEEVTQTNEVIDNEPKFTSTPETPEPTTQTPPGTNSGNGNHPINQDVLIGGYVILAIVVAIVICGIVWGVLTKCRKSEACCYTRDPEKAVADPSIQESRCRLVSVNGSAASTSPDGSRDTVSYQKEAGDE